MVGVLLAAETAAGVVLIVVVRITARTPVMVVVGEMEGAVLRPRIVEPEQVLANRS